MVDNSEPKQITLRRLTLEQEAEKDMRRTGRVLEILQQLYQLSQPEDAFTSPAKFILQENIGMVMSQHVESGGTGSEVFARMQGLGVIKDFPKATKPSEKLDKKNLPAGTVEINRNSDPVVVSTHKYFLAAPPDPQTSEETWQHKRVYDKEIFGVKIDLTVPEGIEDLISEYKTRYAEESATWNRLWREEGN